MTNDKSIAANVSGAQEEGGMFDKELREANIRQLAEDAANRSQWSIEVPAYDILDAPIFAADVEGAICAVGVKHGLNINPAIARDIAAYLRGPFREAIDAESEIGGGWDAR